MKRTWILAVVGLGTAAVVIACWQLIASPLSSVPAQLLAHDSIEPVSKILAPDSRMPVPAAPRVVPALSSHSFAPSADRTRGVRRRPSELSPGVGTTIIVLETGTGDPVERFAMRITQRNWHSESSWDDLAKSATKEMPDGALVVAAPVDGYHFAVCAPGYLPRRGVLSPVSSVDRRALIYLDRPSVVRGRVLYEGEPVVGARVSISVWCSDTRSGWGGHNGKATERGRTDEEGFFEVKGNPTGHSRVSISTDELELEQVGCELTSGGEFDLGDLVLAQKMSPELRLESELIEFFGRPLSDAERSQFLAGNGGGRSGWVLETSAESRSQ